MLARVVFVFLFAASAVMAASEPRAVAEAALIAWSVKDAKSLEAIAHPELKKRCRNARIIQFYVADKELKRQILVSGPDSDIIALLCEALRAIVPPRDDRLEYFDHYINTSYKNDLAVVAFESGWKRKSDGMIGFVSKDQIVLKKSDGQWRFLWSPAVSLHVDLSWNPIE